MSIPDSDVLARLTALVGPAGILADAASMAPYLVEERGLYRGKALAVVRPGTTAEVAAVVGFCAEAGVAVVPQGGNTGLVGGGVPGEDGPAIVLSTRRLRRIRSVDAIDHTITVEAGCILADVQAAAEEADCLFPLSLGAEGSCTIGGNLATNAGGVNVLRYGTARDLTLGLEVVLPDGRVWNGLRALAKDNAGYALRHLFVGSEGTLGVITAAVCKLFPRPHTVETALCALARPDAAVALLARARADSGDSVTAFELIPRIGLEFCLRHLPGIVDPISAPYPWYALIEVSSSQSGAPLRDTLESLLAAAIEDGIAADAVVAASLGQAAGLWRIREGIPEAQKHEGGSIKHDVSVPVSRMADFLRAATQAVEAALPGVRVCAFGHVGDGNVHFNLSQPPGMEKAAFISQWERMNRIVHDIVGGMGGSISAEHGIGRLKRGELARTKDPVELDLMRRVKAAIDPANRMNPGKVLA